MPTPPHIVRVTDLFEENDTAYYVMDYIDGESLRDKLSREGALPEDRALRYTRRVCDALRTVHANHMLHLDIKPANIMVDRHDNVVLIDFGVAKQYDEAGGENTSTVAGYTDGYAPLEQICNNLRSLTPAADLYALGATLYHLLTGVRPPGSATLSSGGDTLKALPADVSASTRRAIDAAMQSAIAARPQSVDAFLTLLEETAPKPAPTPTPAPTPKRAPKPTPIPKPSAKSPIGYIAIAAAALIVGAVIFFLLRGSGSGDADLQGGSMPVAETDSVAAPLNEINGVEYVDLGLPSGKLWAVCNVGATTPYETGYYYSWGEPDAKNSFSTSVATGKSINDYSGFSAYDAATKALGSPWRTPTSAEFSEQVSNTTSEWTTVNGMRGRLFTSIANGRTIFFLAAGYRNDAAGSHGLSLFGDECDYWSSTPADDTSVSKYLCIYSKNIIDTKMETYRYIGMPVRPVTDKPQPE